MNTTSKSDMVAWIRHIAGEGVAVHADPRTGTVAVVLPAGTPRERLQAVRARLHDEVPLTVHFDVTIAQEVASPREAPKEGEVALLPETAAGLDPASPEVVRAERRAREAPLVALVAAMPAGLDPVGWQAMILMLWECWKAPGDEGQNGAADFARWANEGDPEGDPAPLAAAVKLLRGGGAIRNPPLLLAEEAALCYRRAIAPHEAPPSPERRRGGRDVRLVVDHGEG